LRRRRLLAEIKSLYAEAETALNELGGLNRSAELAEESLRLIILRYRNGELPCWKWRCPDDFCADQCGLSRWCRALSGGAGKFANSYGGADDSMKITMTTYMQTQKLSLVSVASIGALLFGMSGCGSRQKRRNQ